MTALPADAGRVRWKRYLVLFGVLFAVLLILAVMIRVMFFHYVEPGHMLIIISKNGESLAEGEVLAEPGQKGIQREVRGEGWHFVWPVVYATEQKPNIVIGKNPKTGLPQVGILKSRGGKTPADNGDLADEGERGIQRKVLLPGSYRINPYGYDIEHVDMVVIKPGYVGVLQRLLGKKGDGAFAKADDQRGIIQGVVLQPGIYPLNTREYKIVSCEIGIYQTSYIHDPDPRKSKGLRFQASDGNTITLDCTVEWELKPEYWPDWLARFPEREVIEDRVVKLHAEKIAQLRGNRYGAEDFLDGEKREAFQKDFQKELNETCKKDKVVIKSAFIRNIIIPDSFLAQKRMERLAVETALTKKELNLTEVTEGDVAEAKQTVELKVGEVKAETERLVGLKEQETDNTRVLTQSELKKMKADYGTKIGKLEAELEMEVRTAKAKAKAKTEQAKSSVYEMKLKLFGNEGDAYLRYTMAQQLNPQMKLRVFHAGPGTLWTNMGDKNMNLMMSLPAAHGTSQSTEKQKTER